ncbi:MULTISPECIES: PA2169 family four-helix-bundle protein [unclassified Pseudomonas]|uniref:PA2169 family four-helix-bundle protein n=1 Tax=unclassified Pseudomonas TaxID=196821 RepID=UPI001BCA9121|nr:PA2169 family four-helix-bundle protein [Pseudomonas sp. Pc102]BBP84201.1 hypothetical protein PHLH8_38430 [Pseudomonas sp. Pc102]
MDNHKAISVLNDLIETSKDGEKGFLECAEDVKNPQLKATFTQRAQECARAAAELQQVVRSMGGDPETSSSVAGALHRRWVDLKALVTGKDDAAILNECERGEDVALKAYKDALGKELPPPARSIVEKQLLGVQRNHDQIKALRNLARAS